MVFRDDAGAGLVEDLLSSRGDEMRREDQALLLVRGAVSISRTGCILRGIVTATPFSLTGSAGVAALVAVAARAL